MITRQMITKASNGCHKLGRDMSINVSIESQS